jgi:hypothetical protein
MGVAPALVLVMALVAAGCASVASLDAETRQAPPPAAIRFGVDTFAFPNESRTKNQGKPDLFANYCFVMARGVIQFHRFARFDPAAPKLAPAAYAERVRQVVAHAPWEDPLPADARVPIPGYASLHAFSREEEPAVKAGLGPRLWTLVHWTNWRVVFPMPSAQQERVVREVLAELASGRPVQLLVTNLPSWELNHTVVAYAYRLGADRAVELAVYDPNDPYAPGLITFDREERRFVATRLFDTTPGAIRAFRMYYSPWL